MAIRHNNVICNNHFHKKWQTRVKSWFNQPARKERRHKRRVEKARRLAPRPVQKLRPIVRCPTFKYNTKQRLGRGFTLAEIKGAGLNKRFAVSIGIAMDYRRKNRSVEGLQQNIQRLKEYRSKLILFPKNPKKPQKGDSSPEEIEMATQVLGTVMPYREEHVTEEPRAITDEEKKYKVYQALTMARADARYVGKRAKRKREREEAEAQTKPKKGK